MRGTPPPDNSDPSHSLGGRGYPPRDPGQTIGGSGYRGGPMAPGPRPNAGSTSRPGANPGATIAGGQRMGAEPGSSYAASRPSPGASLVNVRSMVGITRTGSAVGASITPPEQLLSGNVRRLWISEIASTAGDAILGTGVLIWFTQLRYSFTDVVLLLIAFATPAALVALFAGSLAHLRDARRALWLVGALRVLLAIVFIAMYFDTIIPVALALAFGLSLATSLRGALRRGAVTHGVPVRARGLLASGDQVAAGILAVAGPALATLLYVLNGERIFTIVLGAALCYLVALTGESRAGPLPDRILYQRPVGEAPPVHSAWEADEDPDEDADVIAAEQEAAVWELAAPPNPGAALRDIDDGLQIAGAASHPRYAFIALGALALMGGVLAALEPFYVWTVLHRAPYTLGLLLTAAGLGAAIASAIVVEVRGGGRFFLTLGLLGGGVGLIALGRTTGLNQALAIIASLGAANVFALRGGQVTLMRHFVPVGQRAVAHALGAARAWLAVIGMGAALLLGKSHRIPTPTLGLINLLVLGGICLVIVGILTGVKLLLPNQLAPVDIDDELEPLPDEEDENAIRPEERLEDSACYAAYDESARYPAYDESARYAAYDESARYAAYDESTRHQAYDGTGRSTAHPAHDEAQRRRMRYTDDQDEGDPPPRSRRR